MQVQEEEQRREAMWLELLSQNGPRNVKPAVLRQLGIYGGAAGIWVNAEKTRAVDPDGNGVAVGLLHTGSAYADDLDETGVLYHYPTTNRPGHDRMEIESTKAAKKLGVPLFVITHSPEDSGLRDVYRANVIDWDDEAKIFLVSFNGHAGTATPVGADDDQEPFSLTAERVQKQRLANVRDGQPGFKFRVLRRYGPKCGVCSVHFPELLDAAHIRERKDHGSNDPRNGLVLCATHHRAFDRQLFAIEPNSLRVCTKDGIADFNSLGIENPALNTVRNAPHREALEWRWSLWNGKSGTPAV